MSNNRPDDGSNSSKPSSSSFFSLSSYNRFRLARSQRLDSLQTSSVDSIPYSPREISSAVKKLKIPIGSFKRCTLRNEKVVVFCGHRGFRKPDLSPSHLSTLTSRSHHPSIVKLLGASQSRDGGHIYMVYEDIPGATLKECLQTSNSNPLSKWIWRMQVALDLAQGLEYIHRHCGMVHNIIKSSSVIVTEPNSNASICLFGADDFRSGQNEGTVGYLAPEFFDDIISQKWDVNAFGVVILELISGKAACEQEEDGNVLLVETARETICREAENEDEETKRGRVMQLVDRRLHDSFPMETAESLIKLALKCLEHVPGLRPEMASVAEDIRRLFLESKVWLKQTVKFPTTALSLSLSSLLRGETKEPVPLQRKLLHYPSLLHAFKEMSPAAQNIHAHAQRMRDEGHMIPHVSEHFWSLLLICRNRIDRQLPSQDLTRGI